MIRILFWSLLSFIVYTYIGYPLQLLIYSYLKHIDVKKKEFLPFVSVILSVLNEEKNIEARLNNILSQAYPADRIEIIVVSDGSTDHTNELVKRYSTQNVRLVELKERQGKASTLNQGVACATGEIVVFADARQTFEPNAISELAANFNDSNVGCVSGELIFLDSAKSQISAEMGAYWNYEKRIRKMETFTGSVVGATGAIYAIRRKLFEALPASTLLDDVLTPLNIVRQGYRCIFDSAAVAYDTVSKDMGQEWRRKVRTLTGNWQLLSLRPAILLPWRNPCWWRFLSHKIMRLIAPFALIALFASGMLLTGTFYRQATVVQALIYELALAGILIPSIRKVRIVKPCYFFFMMNMAAVSGFWRWITGRSSTAWELTSSSTGQQYGFRI